MLLHAGLRRAARRIEGRGEERRVVRAHGEKRRGKGPDVTTGTRDRQDRQEENRN
jgi:hypothetical protein